MHVFSRELALLALICPHFYLLVPSYLPVNSMDFMSVFKLPRPIPRPTSTSYVVSCSTAEHVDAIHRAMRQQAINAFQLSPSAVGNISSHGPRNRKSASSCTANFSLLKTAILPPHARTVFAKPAAGCTCPQSSRDVISSSPKCEYVYLYHQRKLTNDDVPTSKNISHLFSLMAISPICSGTSPNQVTPGLSMPPH